jgi:hypothetical protein
MSVSISDITGPITCHVLVPFSSCSPSMLSNFRTLVVITSASHKRQSKEACPFCLAPRFPLHILNRSYSSKTIRRGICSAYLVGVPSKAAQTSANSCMHFCVVSRRSAETADALAAIEMLFCRRCSSAVVGGVPSGMNIVEAGCAMETLFCRRGFLIADRLSPPGPGFVQAIGAGEMLFFRHLYENHDICKN